MNEIHQLFRKLNPASRAPGQFVHGGGTQSKHFRCVYCNATSVSYCGNYKPTRRALAFTQLHDCAEKRVLAELVKREADLRASFGAEQANIYG